MDDNFLCIHGHFYQPPREDPWLGTILPEGSAAPWLNWNQRITRESYAPLARARRLDGSSRITEVMNCYEWMSFNAGPTLLHWMAQTDPDTLRLMVEADRASAKRLGHGNAMAQVYHHQILPLASQLDKELEVAWAVDDFTARFGRAPEGMWLAEAAVDTASLEVLARAGIAFTVLAPRQARAVGPLEDGALTPVDQGSLDIRRPYLVRLPSGRHISVFFYDGPLSQAVAFERLLADGGDFWRRLAGASGPGLTALATDGETYGHHFTFGEMALAYVLDQAREGRGGPRLTNFAAFLADNPPTRRVELHEPSSWSCAHGVERWRSDCGCTDGGHPGWRQTWRGPLRKALQDAKDAADQHFFQRGALCFKDPREALTRYGRVLSGLATPEAFARDHFLERLPAPEQDAAWKLLAMQQWGLASLASCAWFFDEISRIEPVNAMTYALRALELMRRTGGPDMEAPFAEALRQAPSNLPEYGDGAGVLRACALPRRETPASLTAQALWTLWAEDRLPAPGASARVAWPGVAVTVTPSAPGAGKVSIAWNLEPAPDEASYRWTPPPSDPDPARDPLSLPVTVTHPGGEESFVPRALPVNKRQALADAFARRAAQRAWDAGKAAMAVGANLVTELQEAQTTMTLAQLWAGQWTHLAWAWLNGLEIEGKRLELLKLFLGQCSGDPREREALMERVCAHALALAASDAPDWTALSLLVERARSLGLPEDWWSVQNLLWDLGLHHGAGRDFARQLGFA
ncbi:DUF3536 domain-containing protein [Fundidesulfovibrio magnetotacticus]|uniref:DUF3536 domain-containing protein n=1 Tax=Fundidesulfovibrio magnetotacticus TaxID=2730080 RepID=UPI001F42B59B|nr:DUF3536 domain-containing protein [Fundidesulfovibrio magnetotacticus]